MLGDKKVKEETKEEIRRTLPKVSLITWHDNNIDNKYKDLFLT